MREIKFRAWFTRDETYVKPMAIQNMIHQKVSKFSLSVLYNECVFEEFTGLKDKNGVDVYEGDVVETTYYNDVDDDFGKIGTIVFERGGFYIIFVGDNSKNNLGFIEPDETMVIGNIHQNADLLEEQS